MPSSRSSLSTEIRHFLVDFSTLVLGGKWRSGKCSCQSTTKNQSWADICWQWYDKKESNSSLKTIQVSKSTSFCEWNMMQPCNHHVISLHSGDVLTFSDWNPTPVCNSCSLSIYGDKTVCLKLCVFQDLPNALFSTNKNNAAVCLPSFSWFVHSQQHYGWINLP